MTQKFFTDTLVSKFIKYILSYTPLPLYPTIEHNQYMIKGCTYIHKDKVLRCTSSGIFNGLPEYLNEYDYLYCSDNITVQSADITDYLKITDWHGEEFYSPLVVSDSLLYIKRKKFAEYDLINDFVFGEAQTGVTQRFVSNISYYDPQTHKFLGDYLRLVKNYYGLDLMSLYNCYNYNIVTNICLKTTAPFVTDEYNDKRKVLLVPIKFNTEYTVAMDSISPILMKAVVYKNNGLVTDISGSDFVSNQLADDTRRVSSCQFKRPITFMVENKVKAHIEKVKNDEKVKYLQQFENDLYLAIQVPNNFNNTLTVLEGNYSNTDEQRVTDISIIHNADKTQIDKSLLAVPSLLKLNDGAQHPFSDKLIAYLLRNTIDEREYIDDNVANIEKKIGYTPLYQGMWDSKLRYILYNKYMNINNKDELNKEDILGFVDIDIEEAVRKGYIEYVT